MATIQFNAYQIHKVTVYGVSISLGIGQPPPFASETVEASKLADIKQAFDAYVAKAKESGKQLQLSARVKNGRSPNGFDKAKLRENVNI